MGADDPLYVHDACCDRRGRVLICNWRCYLALLMALVCFGIGISKGYSALWSAAAGFFGHVIAAAILLLLPDREQGAAEAKWRRDAKAQEIAQLKARVAQLEALLTPPAPPPEEPTQAKAVAGEKTGPGGLSLPDGGERRLSCLRQAPAGGPGPVLFLRDALSI